MKREVAIVGAGYVGVPLARTFADAGTSVLLVDVDPGRVAQLNAGESYIEDVPTDVLKPLVEAGLVAATTDYDELREVDAILVALPTPLSRPRSSPRPTRCGRCPACGRLPGRSPTGESATSTWPCAARVPASPSRRASRPGCTSSTSGKCGLCRAAPGISPSGR